MSVTRKQKGFSSVFILLGLLVVVTTGTVSMVVLNRNQVSKQVANSKSDTKTELEDTLPTNLTNLQQVSTIQDKVVLPEGATILGIELENEHGVLVYKVKLSDGTFLYFDATTGEPTTKPIDDVDEDQDQGEVPKSFVTSINLDTARKIAQDLYPDKTIKKIKLESEEGVIVYSVRFKDGTRVDVSAVDGSVIRSRENTNNTNSSGSDHKSTTGTKHESESGDDNDDHSAPVDATAGISIGQAREIALSVRSGTIDKAETESEHGSVVYSFRYSDGARVDVRASDGTVVRNDP